MNISHEKFQSFVKIQMAGLTNMLDIEKVSKYSGLNRKEIVFIINNYSTLYEKYMEN
jgi:hypothetical protein